MSQAERRVKQALIDSSLLSPEGSAKAQRISGSMYIAIPAELAQHHEISQGIALERAYHPASSTLVTSLDGSSLFEV